MQSEIKRWGNSAAVRLPKDIMAQAKLHPASPITIEVKGRRIIIQAAPVSARKVKLPFTEEELLRGLDAHRAHADELAEIDLSEAGF